MTEEEAYLGAVRYYLNSARAIGADQHPDQRHSVVSAGSVLLRTKEGETSHAIDYHVDTDGRENWSPRDLDTERFFEGE